MISLMQCVKNVNQVTLVDSLVLIFILCATSITFRRVVLISVQFWFIAINIWFLVMVCISWSFWSWRFALPVTITIMTISSFVAVALRFFGIISVTPTLVTSFLAAFWTSAAVVSAFSIRTRWGVAAWSWSSAWWHLRTSGSVTWRLFTFFIWFLACFLLITITFPNIFISFGWSGITWCCVGLFCFLSWTRASRLAGLRRSWFAATTSIRRLWPWSLVRTRTWPAAFWWSRFSLWSRSWTTTWTVRPRPWPLSWSWPWVTSRAGSTRPWPVRTRSRSTPSVWV